MLKLWAFNIGHPCPSLAKGSWLAARLLCFEYTHSPRHPQRPNHIKFICRKTEGSLPSTFLFQPSPPKEYILHSIRRGGGLPRPLPRLSPLPQALPTRTIPRPAPLQITICAAGAPQLFIIHYSSFISPHTPRTKTERRS